MADSSSNGAALASFQDQFAALTEIADRLKRQKDPVRDPAQIALVRDPETGKRIPQTRITPSGIEVVFLPFTIGEARSYGAHNEGQPFARWPIEEQVRLLNENVRAPDFEELAGGPLTVAWVEANFDWLSFIEIGTEVLKGSRVDFRVPVITMEEEKKDRGRPSDSPSRSTTPSSTTGDTATSESETSAD